MRKNKNHDAPCIVLLQLFAILCVGCADSAEPEPLNVDMLIEVDMAVSVPDVGIGSLPLTPSEDAPPEFTELEPNSVQAFWLLADGSIFWRSDAGYTHYSRGERTLLNPTTVDIQDAVIVQGQLLVSDGASIFVLSDLEFQPSPLNDEFQAPIRLLGLDTNAFWISERQGLHRWRDKQIVRVQSEIGVIDPTSAWTAVRDGRDELVIWHGMSATHLRLDGDLLSEMTIEFTNYPLHIGLSKSGLWVLEESRLFWLNSEQEWHYADLDTEAQALYTSGLSETIHVLTDSEIMHIQDFELTRTSRPQALTHFSVSVDGSLLGLADGALSMLSSAINVNLVGGFEGPLLSSKTIQAQWDDALIPVEIAWSVDEVEQPGITADFLIEPTQTTPGIHILKVNVTFEDGRAVTSDIAFEGPPTWATHIEPIAQAQCLNCHDAGAQTELSEENQWIERFESIQYNVETERMPLTPEKLTPAQVGLIRGWGLAEFPQGGQQ